MCRNKLPRGAHDSGCSVDLKEKNQKDSVISKSVIVAFSRFIKINQKFTKCRDFEFKLIFGVSLSSLHGFKHVEEKHFPLDSATD